MILALLSLFLLFVTSAQAAVCSITTTSTGWTWTCPQLPAAVGSVCKDVAEDGIDYSNGHSITSATLISKYGSVATAYNVIGTVKFPNIGITTAGQYSYTYISNYPTNGMPYEPTEDMGFYTQRDTAPFHLQNQANVVTPTGMTCNGNSWFAGETPDDWDPNAQTFYNDLWGNNKYGTAFFSAAVAGQVRDYIPDDGDSLFVYDSIPTHPDFGYILAANSPVQVKSDCASNQASCPGGSFDFSDTTRHVKIGVADYLGGEYGCVGSTTSITALSETGFIATATVANSFTAGTMVIISGATPAGYNNSGYPVLVLPQGLSGSQFEYVLTVSGLGAPSVLPTVAPVESPLVTSGTDPNGVTSCGATKIASSLSALNTAWGTSFTTWGTSDTNGLNGIKFGGGTSICASATVANTWQSNHAYSANTLIYDGTNYEYTGAACTSAGSAPTWSTLVSPYHGSTQDNTCVWFNFGTTGLAPYPSPQCTGNGAGTNIAYASWGTGTGFLDEAGSHILSSSFKSGCGTTPPVYTDTWGNTATVKADMQQFVGADAALHAIRQRGGYSAICSSNCPPLGDLYYDSPTEAYQQIGPTLDLVVISPNYYATQTAAVNRDQVIINAVGDEPVRVHNYGGVYTTPAISSCHTDSINHIGVDVFSCKGTESAEGAAEANYDNAVLRLKNTLGHYAVIGYGHWMTYDWNNGSSSGPFSISDNAYDGSNASTLTTCASTWTANHTYTTPTCITDGTNHEYLSVTGETGQTCTSGGATPSWATGYGQLTHDNTCHWFNGSTYTQIAEAASYGNALLPLQQFWTGAAIMGGTLCDPSASVSANAGTARRGIW